MNFEEDDEEEEEAPAYIKTKRGRRYMGGSKGPMGGQGSSRSKGMVKMSAVKITRVHREEEDEEEEKVAADEEGQEEEVEENKVEEEEEKEVEEEQSSTGEPVQSSSSDEQGQGAPNVKTTVEAGWRKGLGKVVQKPVKGAKRV
ncbi:hypothetical protein L211DRAFT_852338 [Terfezia boudieri ATCC MYA-4762]|uniref:Uncharacterized protein n=1 Tax=Terfezia boudieri ATCC MYA-4762 TaxID=1051890 RepID=A0A3N4LBW6_9PEZI|nr:hypothetical protein L211DRAFT_852338 [Terfezia boudieri ATCC MYA-4762]